MTTHTSNSKKLFLLTVIVLLIVSFNGYSQYLPLTGGTLSGNLNLNNGTQIQTPYLGFNSSFTQPANSSNVALYPNNSTLTLDIVSFDNGWRFVPSSSNSYPAPVVSIDHSGNTNIAGSAYVGNNLGVGTATPLSKIHVFNSYNVNNTTGLKLFYQGTWGTVDYANKFRFLDVSSTEGGGLLEVNGYGIGIGCNPPVFMSSDKLYINGNVGIGTTAPDAMLTVKGNIHAQQITVDLNVPAGDYVFEPTYKLPDLTALKTYLDKNHHLPEIPSATELAKNGMNLGDMNELLLKKVEELTLYLIDKNKDIRRQRQEIDALNKKVDVLLKTVLQQKISRK